MLTLIEATELESMAQDLTMADLSQSARVQPRIIRKYIEYGLMDRPVGRTKNARYSPAHLAQLLLIRRLVLGGMTLTQVKKSLEPEAAQRLRPALTGAVDMRVVQLARDCIVMMSGIDTGLTQDEQDRLIAGFAQVYANVRPLPQSAAMAA